MHELLRSEVADSYEFVSYNPATEEEIGRIPLQTREQIDVALEKANREFKNWAETPLRERLKYVRRLKNVIYDQSEEIATLLAKEQGKTKTEALLSEIAAVLMILKKIPAHARQVLREKRAPHEMILFSHKKSSYRFEPYGVVVVISPWNFPFSVPIPEIVSAIVAGNTVIFKPAPGTPFIGKKIDDLFRQAGFPKGVLTTIFISDEDASYLTSHPGVDKIIFTGSVQTGTKVMCAAAGQQFSVLLELGGKDAAIVAADADIERAARGIVWGATFNSGQVCASVERVYVERPVAGKFIAQCLENIKKIRVGDPLSENTDVGPMENERQMLLVLSHLSDALQKGAKLLYGGERIGKRGYFLQPALLIDVDHSMKVMTEETFGPVLPIMVVDSLNEAIRLANDVDFGLSAYGWTGSKKTARRMMEELQAGTVVINDATFSWAEPNAPWGGFKKSGIGRTRGIPGLQEMVQLKYVSYDKGNNETNFWWFPADSTLKSLSENSLKFLFARNIGTRLKGLFKLISQRRFVKNFHWGATLKNIHKVF
ncbi:MAG: aldehyde dehydrogenase family protein [Calditrichaeota bacterium]|nr:aldehyde dehydrogenase family protein [Calditrichota bacterium]